MGRGVVAKKDGPSPLGPQGWRLPAGLSSGQGVSENPAGLTASPRPRVVELWLDCPPPGSKGHCTEPRGGLQETLCQFPALLFTGPGEHREVSHPPNVRFGCSRSPSTSPASPRDGQSYLTACRRPTAGLNGRDKGTVEHGLPESCGHRPERWCRGEGSRLACSHGCGNGSIPSISLGTQALPGVAPKTSKGHSCSEDTGCPTLQQCSPQAWHMEALGVLPCVPCLPPKVTERKTDSSPP